MKAPITARLEQLERLNPKKFKAIETLIDFALEESTVLRVEPGRKLLSKLQAQHDCPQPDGGSFEQIPPAGGVRQWRCSGCGVIVTLD